VLRRHGAGSVAGLKPKLLPGVTEVAEARSPEAGAKYRKIVGDLLAGDAHVWKKGMTPAEVEAMRKAYEERYQQKN
jgi:hypothetical protein